MTIVNLAIILFRRCYSPVAQSGELEIRKRHLTCLFPSDKFDGIEFGRTFVRPKGELQGWSESAQSQQMARPGFMQSRIAQHETAG